MTTQPTGGTPLSRRRLLVEVSTHAASALLVATAFAGCGSRGRGPDRRHRQQDHPGWRGDDPMPPRQPPRASAATPHFVSPMPIPPVLRPTRRDRDGIHYRITQRAATAEIIPGLPVSS